MDEQMQDYQQTRRWLKGEKPPAQGRIWRRKVHAVAQRVIGAGPLLGGRLLGGLVVGFLMIYSADLVPVLVDPGTSGALVPMAPELIDMVGTLQRLTGGMIIGGSVLRVVVCLVRG